MSDEDIQTPPVDELEGNGAKSDDASSPEEHEDPFAELKAIDAQKEAEAAAQDAEADAPRSDAPQPGTEPEPVAEATGEAPPPEEAPEEQGTAEEPPAPAANPAFRYADKYYAPISPDSPTGKAIEHYHFAEMDQELLWPRNEFDRPDPEQRPNFRAVKKMALDFLDGTKEIKATKDVRPLLCLMTAEAGDAGPIGLAKAVDLFVANAVDFWPELHPQKEDEDDDELMTRMEEMRRYFNPQVISLAVESVTIAKSPRVGEMTTRTFGIASEGIRAREGEFAPDSDAINALMEQEPEVRERIVEIHAAYRHAIGRLEDFRTFLDDHPDVDPVDLESVAETLETLAGYIAPFIGQAASPGESDEDAEDSGAPDTGSTASVIGPKTLEEAVALIDDILTFYANQGRSSPVPLALLAIRDLTYADFNAWIAQTAASGLNEAAISISAIDASRLSEFATGDTAAAAAAAAPAPTVVLDFTELDAQLDHMVTAIGYTDMAAARLQSEDSETQPLADEIAGLKSVLDSIRAARNALGPAPAPETGSTDMADGENTPEGDSRHSRITSRNDVKASLDLIAAFFEREEPSSPAPVYLKRLRSLVDARFSEIARELMGEDGYEPKLRLEPRRNIQ